MKGAKNRKEKEGWRRGKGGGLAWEASEEDTRIHTYHLIIAWLTFVARPSLILPTWPHQILSSD